MDNSYLGQKPLKRNYYNTSSPSQDMPSALKYNNKGSPVGQTQYIPLTNQDLIYFGNLQRFKSNDFLLILRKVARDLSFFLQFKYDDFWMELTTSQGLRKCLQSCLHVFPRKRFCEYINKSSLQNKQQQNIGILQTEMFAIFSILMRTVLFIYYRIICESRQEEKKIIYQFWLFDVPKMLNLISIYKNSNISIVRQILNCAFKELPQYRNDIMEVASICRTTFIEALQKDLKYEYTQKIIKQCKNFNKPIFSFTKSLIKSIFRTFDIFNSINDIISFFPTKYVIIILNQPGLVLSLIDAFFQYSINISGRWQIMKQFQTKFVPIIQITRQKMMQFFVKTFDVLDKVLQVFLNQEQWFNCLRVYYQLCMEFYYRNQSDCTMWQMLINTIILQTPHRSIFRLQPYISKNLVPQQLQIIKQCQKYEKDFRQDLARKNFRRDQILQLKISAIKSFRQWKQFEYCKSFDFLIENSHIEETLKQDSVLNILQAQMRNAHLEKLKKNSNALYYYQNRKKSKITSYPKWQYNDQPIYPLQKDIQNQLYLPPFEQKQNNDNEIGIEDKNIKQQYN